MITWTVREIQFLAEGWHWQKSALGASISPQNSTALHGIATS